MLHRKRRYHNVRQSRLGEPLGAILEAVPKLYDAKKLMAQATYVNGIGSYGKRERNQI